MKYLIAMILCLGIAAGVPPSMAGEVPLGLPGVPVPEGNPQTEEKIALGKRLFEERRFSGDNTVSCATCHLPEKAFTDGRPVAVGIGKQEGNRNSPTVVNAAYYTTQFWDGRSPSLEAQARDPFLNPVEHGLANHEPILETIRNDPAYPKAFKEVFGVKRSAITIDHVAMAIASFERTKISGDSPFDRFLYGKEPSAMTESAIRGLEIFRDKGRCQSCHSIEQTHALFTNNDFHNIGVGIKRILPRLRKIAGAYKTAKMKGVLPDSSMISSSDISELGHFVVTLRPSDIGKFKTPTLRNISVTGPYMHDGSVKTLEEVITLYDKGGEANPMLDGGIRVLSLTDLEKADLLEFLEHLTSPEYERSKP